MSVNVNITEKYVNKDYYNQECCSNPTAVGGGGTAIHREMAEIDLTGTTDYHIVITFPTAFNAKPFGRLRVFRYVPRTGGGLGIQDVLFTYPDANWLTEIGFTIDISAFEALDGAIVEYQYTE